MRKKKLEQPFFCHPSWILLRFLRWLCAYVAVHHISGGDGEEKKKSKLKYIYIYMLVQSSFFLSRLHGSRERSRHYCLGICRTMRPRCSVILHLLVLFLESS